MNDWNGIFEYILHHSFLWGDEGRGNTLAAFFAQHAWDGPWSLALGSWWSLVPPGPPLVVFLVMVPWSAEERSTQGLGSTGPL